MERGGVNKQRDEQEAERGNEPPPGLGVRLPSGAFVGAPDSRKAPENWRSPERYRVGDHLAGVHAMGIAAVVGTEIHREVSAEWLARGGLSQKSSSEERGNFSMFGRPSYS